MSLHRVTFEVAGEAPENHNGAHPPYSVEVPTGTLLTEAARLAGIDLMQPCGAQGRCGRCAVKVTEGVVRQRSTLRLSQDDLKSGYALACQSVVEGDLYVVIPPQEKIERRLTTDLTVSKISVPPRYDFRVSQSIQRLHLTLNPPSMDDQTDDWSRLQLTLRKVGGFNRVDASLPLLRKIGGGFARRGLAGDCHPERAE
jgi:ferredoxin